MEDKWKDPKIVIGNVAEGDCYYPRNEIVEQIWNELEKGSSILIAAPRRVGKTSVMEFMKDAEKENYKLIFSNIQGIDSADKFYERIYTLLLNCLNKSNKAKKWFKNFLKSKSITEITLNGLKFERKPTDFLKETNDLLVEINNNKETGKIVLLIDELPEVLFKINKTNSENAISILKNLRHWRQQPEMNKKVQFVLAGSIGIHYAVNAIEQRNSDLNDLATIDFPPLLFSEVCTYIDWATNTATIHYSEELKNYLANKIAYYVPFFINIMLDEINKEAKKNNNPNISTKDIDKAFDKIVKNSDHFEDWKNRLKKYMPPGNFNFVNEILTHAAHRDKISLQEIYDKAVKYNKTADYMDFIHDLEKDGYITETNEKYVFISPFLSAFWKKNNPVYNG
ncbi:MAG: AAA-like domain-containing protein [Dysgonamonadaceae bacterium]|jgi:hypothetical protein|nr:AAA-like domain-containing protein [Dysgonamonadaceae bacterium]